MSFIPKRFVFGRTFWTVVIAIYCTVGGGIIGYKAGENVVREELGDRYSNTQVVGWCVRSSVGAMLDEGEPSQVIINEIPGISQWCSDSWGEYKGWLAHIKEREDAARSQETE